MYNKKINLNDIALLLLRVGVGLILFYYGAQKVFGLFGGHGFNATLAFFENQLHIGPVFAVLAMAGELLGGLGLCFGLLTRVAAFGAACTMFTATWFNWHMPGMIDKTFVQGDPSGPPQLFFALILGIVCLSILLSGGGRLALDNVLFGKQRK